MESSDCNSIYKVSLNCKCSGFETETNIWSSLKCTFIPIDRVAAGNIKLFLYLLCFYSSDNRSFLHLGKYWNILIRYIRILRFVQYYLCHPRSLLRYLMFYHLCFLPWMRLRRRYSISIGPFRIEWDCVSLISLLDIRIWCGRFIPVKQWEKEN